MKHFQVARTISQIMKCAPRPRSHEKARCEIYPRTELKRPVLDDEKVTWDVKYEDYAPINYTSASILAGPVYADPNYLDDESLLNEKPAKWNSIDGKIDRRSHHGPYAIVNNLPRNPVGRTGVIGRGMLGRWGPNHAADPIVTRWKRDPSGKKVTMPLGAKGGKPVLQFIAIQRRDSLEWAIPGFTCTMALVYNERWPHARVHYSESQSAFNCTVHRYLSRVFKQEDQHLEKVAGPP